MLLDVLMPEMDGWTLLSAGREMSEVPVIMLTALEREDDKVGALRSGADDYLSSPLGGTSYLPVSTPFFAGREESLDKTTYIATRPCS